MSNILTDILGFFKRRKFVQEAKDDDVLILGVNESPDMLGIASPVPYKDARLIKVKDLITSNTGFLYQNLGAGEGIYAGETIIGEQKYQNFKSLRSLSLNLTVSSTATELQFNTTAEPNTAANVGSGSNVYKDKTGETLNFRSIISSDGSVGITQSTNEIDLTVPAGTGEVNTASNIGAGTGLFAQKNGVDLEFKSLTSTGGTVTITNTASTVNLESSGEANTAINLGTGTGLFKQKAAEELEFYSLTSSDNSIDIDLVTQDNVIDLKAAASSNTQAAGTFLQGARYVYNSPTDLTYFNTAIIAITDFGFGYFNLPDISGVTTQPLQHIRFGTRLATDPVGGYNEKIVGIGLGNSQGYVVDWPNLPATAKIKVTFTCYVEASVPPTVIYLGLHNRTDVPLANNTELQYGWQAVGVDPDTENQLTQVHVTWIIDVDDVVDHEGKSLRTDPTAGLASFGFYGGSNASGDKLLFGAQWNAEIPNAVDQQWTGPGIAEVHLIDNDPTTRFPNNPLGRS